MFTGHLDLMSSAKLHSGRFDDLSNTISHIDFSFLEKSL